MGILKKCGYDTKIYSLNKKYGDYLRQYPK